MIDRLADYNVVWDSPSQNSSGSMPLGNGDIALNAWMEPTGDLLILIAKGDAWDENSTNLKLGRIRLKISPNPLTIDTQLRQTLHLRTAQIEIITSAIRIRLWVDANHPVIHFEFDGEKPFDVQATLKMWRTEPRPIKTQTSDMFKNLSGKNADPFPTIVQPDRVLDGPPDRVIWCHHNEKPDPDPYEINMKLQGLGQLLDRQPHPLTGRTFGAAMEGPNFVRSGPKTLHTATPSQSHRLNIYALTSFPATPQRWQTELENQIAAINQIDLEKARREHEQWWHQFWNRSWIYVTATNPEESAAAFSVTQGYILQRFMNAAAGRAAPIKHNGSLFTVGQGDDPDFRRWGGPGFWFQNQRLIYWPMLAAGDFDLMQPWLAMYRNMLPLQQHRTQKYFHHDGAHFPETVTFWGAEVSSHYGWTPFEKRSSPEAESSYLRYYWTGGIELTLMLCEYVAYTQDQDFARDTLLPIANAVITFFDLHYRRDQNGKIRFEPAQSLETWHEAINPTPEIAGLSYTLKRLLALDLKDAPKEQWQRLLGELPDIPTAGRDGKKIILPAEQFDKKKNVENPEIYCVFPYRLFGVGKPDLQLARDTFEVRLHPSHDCWSQDDIQMTLLGLTEQAKQWITKRASAASHSDSRFPAFWNAFHDWLPDVDHGGVLQMALQLMLMQAEAGEIIFLPAWPKEWNADFKLHAPNRMIVEGSVRDGQLTNVTRSQ